VAVRDRNRSERRDHLPRTSAPARPRERPERREVLYGLHPILEAIESGRRSIERILVAREGFPPGVGRVLRQAREAGIPISHLPREVLAKQAGRGAVHQGIAALVSAAAYADAAALTRAALRAQGILVALDGVTDPGNLGAILRTVAGAGALGVLVGAEGTVGLTPAVAKTSAGLVEQVPVARVAKLARELTGLRERGFRVLALDSSGSTRWSGADWSGPVVLLAGGEGSGLKAGLLETADQVVSIPLAPGVESLNVSVAVGVALFEAIRQRGGTGSDLSQPDRAVPGPTGSGRPERPPGPGARRAGRR
jgi:23S rRNA (guanosine2251-2'-O)-methyltransferase